MKTVSVIVTCYNCEKYVEKTLNSLIKQSYKINEIIVIDDCSSDKTRDIVSKIAKKNSNIIFFKNSENKGVSYSRNFAIKKATSDYLMFCDGDDWYEYNAVEELINSATKENADYVVAGYYITYDDGRKISIKFNDLFENNIITKEECISVMPITSSSKLISREVIIKNNLEYPLELKNCEELAIIPVSAFYSKKVFYLDKCLYNYYQRSNSSSNKKINNLDFFDISYKQFKSKLPNKYESSIKQRMIEHIVYSKTMVMVKNKFSKEEIIKHINESKHELKGIKLKSILSKLPFRKKVFVLCALTKNIFILKLYVKLQNKLIG